MANKILITYTLIDIFFAGTGALMLVYAIMSYSEMKQAPNNDNIATNLLLARAPLRTLTVNAILTLLAFLASLPGVVSTRNRFFLRLQSVLLVATALLTLAVGLIIWFSTLKTRSSLGTLWALQTPAEQQLLQQRFRCCGYTNSTSPPFQIDSVCPDAKTAATKPGCVGPFSGFANSYLDVVFTALFGIVAVDGFTFLAGMVVLKDRAEKKRYRMIDEKGGYGGI